eukprot:gene9396-8419_t
MGHHWFYALATAPTMSWQAENLLPVVPMYDGDNALNAFFFASSVRQQSLLPPGANQWEPVPLPNNLMCGNFCDGDCTFAGTSIWSTMHIYLHDHEPVNVSMPDSPGGSYLELV